MSDAARRGGAEAETAMVIAPKRSGALVLRLIVGLALLGWPRVGSVVCQNCSFSCLSFDPGER